MAGPFIVAHHVPTNSNIYDWNVSISSSTFLLKMLYKDYLLF